MAIENIFKNFPILEIDDDVVLRKFESNDFHKYLQYMSNDKVIEFIPKECIPLNEEDAKNEINYCNSLFKFRKSIYWGIALKETNELIGSCGYNYLNLDHKKGEISYDLNYDFWGKRIMSKVLNKVIDYSFNEIKLNRIEAVIVPENKRSIELLLRKGFIKEGLLRQQKLLHNKFHDAFIFSLLNSDLKK